MTQPIKRYGCKRENEYNRERGRESGFSSKMSRPKVQSGDDREDNIYVRGESEIVIVVH